MAGVIPVTTLDTFASAIVDGAGTATAEVGPSGVERWRVTMIALRVSTNAVEPTAQLYLSRVEAGRLISGTYVGSLNSMSVSNGIVVLPGESLVCVWEGADPGARATLSVFGEKTGA